MYLLPYSSHTSHHPSQTPCLSWISYATPKLMLDSCKMVEKQSEAFHTFLWPFFLSLKQNFISYHSSKVSDFIFENPQLWQSDFSRVYSNCCCCCLFEPEIMRIGQSAHNIYSNNIVSFQESTTISNAYTKNVWKLIEGFTLFKVEKLSSISLYLLTVSHIEQINPVKVTFKCDLTNQNQKLR